MHRELCASTSDMRRVMPAMLESSFYLGEANIDPASILKRFGNPVYSVNHVSINASQTPSKLCPNEPL
jgi:hypothetical protein